MLKEAAGDLGTAALPKMLLLPWLRRVSISGWNGERKNPSMDYAEMGCYDPVGVGGGSITSTPFCVDAKFGILC